MKLTKLNIDRIATTGPRQPHPKNDCDILLLY